MKYRLIGFIGAALVACPLLGGYFQKQEYKKMFMVTLPELEELGKNKNITYQGMSIDPDTHEVIIQAYKISSGFSRFQHKLHIALTYYVHLLDGTFEKNGRIPSASQGSALIHKKNRNNDDLYSLYSFGKSLNHVAYIESFDLGTLAVLYNGGILEIVHRKKSLEFFNPKTIDLFFRFR